MGPVQQEIKKNASLAFFFANGEETEEQGTGRERQKKLSDSPSHGTSSKSDKEKREGQHRGNTKKCTLYQQRGQSAVLGGGGCCCAPGRINN